MQPAHVSSLFQLEYPKPVVVVNDYETAQKVVDHLSDKEFPVENLCIVGTDLRSIERVIGRKTWGTVLGQGAISGVGMGLLVGLMMSFFYSLNSLVVMLLSGLLIGVVIGIGGVIKAAPMFMNQKIGKGCLVVLGALVAFGLLINLNLTMSGAKTVSKVIGSIFESGDEFTDEYTSMGPNGFTITLPSADSNGTTSA